MLQGAATSRENSFFPLLPKITASGFFAAAGLTVETTPSTIESPTFLTLVVVSTMTKFFTLASVTLPLKSST